ncbi:MAG: hypothetical protein QOG04_2350 [Actinomycetota bacterium]|jgi:hypothetical protein|nr:hypothetical protein [Actinomycetota bacterium]
MKSTYARVMTGSRVTRPPVRKLWVYLLIGVILASMVSMAPRETIDLATDPIGVAAALAIVMGLLAKKSMSLTPWALVALALTFYWSARHWSTLESQLQVAQLLVLAVAIVVGALQLRITLESGAAADHPSRARWGSVLVALTAATVVIALGFPRVPLVVYFRGPPVEKVAGPSIPAGRFAPRTRVGRIQDPGLTEISGLAASTNDPDVFWAHNDSGGAPALYCLLGSGASCGTWDVAGAVNTDWEDIDIGPGPVSGRSYIYVGDIGDNAAARGSVTVYRMLEPDVDPATSDGGSLPADAIRFRYPDGPHDAETLLIHPLTGDLYIVTKELTSGVYKAAAPFDTDSVLPLERVARFSLFANFADRTGGDIAPDGQSVVLTTYGGVYELVLTSQSAVDGFDEIWHVGPTVVDRGAEGQLEAVTYSSDGRSVLFVPEGARSVIWRSTLKRT